MGKRPTNEDAIIAFVNKENKNMQSSALFYRDNALTSTQALSYTHKYFENTYAILIDDTIYINDSVRIPTPAFGGANPEGLLNYHSNKKNYKRKHLSQFTGVFKYIDEKNNNLTIEPNYKEGWKILINDLKNYYNDQRKVYINSRSDNHVDYPILMLLGRIQDCIEFIEKAPEEELKEHLNNFTELEYCVDYILKYKENITPRNYLRSAWIRPWDTNREKREQNKIKALDPIYIEKKKKAKEVADFKRIEKFYTDITVRDLNRQKQHIDYIPLRLLMYKPTAAETDKLYNYESAIDTVTSKDIQYNYDFLNKVIGVYSILPWGIDPISRCAKDTLSFILHLLIIRRLIYIQHDMSPYERFKETFKTVPEEIKIFLNHNASYGIRIQFSQYERYRIGCKDINKNTIDFFLNRYFDLGELFPFILQYIDVLKENFKLDAFLKEIKEPIEKDSLVEFVTKLKQWVGEWFEDEIFMNEIKENGTR